MTDHSSLPARLNLPDNIQSLGELRDQLAEYLATLEYNTTVADRWLRDNQDQVIVALHQLVRAVVIEKDEGKALAWLQSVPADRAGFVLGLEDFTATAQSLFGKDSAFAAKIKDLQTGLPQSILKAVPHIAVPENMATLSRPQSALPPKAPEKPEGMLSGWFKSAEAKEAEQLAADFERLTGRWRDLHRDLIALHSDRHYYVDSFMDWIGENLAPTNPEQDFATLMESYQSPAYVVAHAEDDYAQVIVGKVEALKNAARAFSQVASMLDTQDIPALVKRLPSLFSAQPGTLDARYRQMILDDRKAYSFADIALKDVTTRENQLLLLDAAMDVEHKLLARSPLAVAATMEMPSPGKRFSHVLDHVLADKDPLPPLALRIVAQKDTGIAENKKEAVIESRAIARIAHKFQNDLPAMEKMLGWVFEDMPANATLAVKQVVAFAQACQAQDIKAIGAVLGSITSSGTSTNFRALWEVFGAAAPASGFAQSPFDTLLAAAGKMPAVVSGITCAAINAGIADELSLKKEAAYGSADNFSTFSNYISTYALPNIATFNDGDLGFLLAASGLTADNSNYRTRLTARKGGWLAQVLESDVDDDTKQKWLVRLLTPLGDTIRKTNVLSEAAHYAENPDTARVLTALEYCLVGRDIPLQNNKLLMNAQNIANIWFNDSPNRILYTVSGAERTLLHTEVAGAREIFALISRRHSFVDESGALLNPKLVDRFEFTDKAAFMYWGRNKSHMYVDAKTLSDIKAHEDFFHEKPSGYRTAKPARSINKDALAAALPREDGSWLVIDRYGSVDVLENLTLPRTLDPIVAIGGGYFNPQAASVINFAADDSAVSFRIESTAFDEFLNKSVGSENFFTIQIGKAADARALKDQLDKDATMASPGGELSNLYFNMGVLAFLQAQTSKGHIGFHCHKAGNERTGGFLHLHQQIVEEIVAGLAHNQPHLLQLNGLTVLPAMVDDAYFDASGTQPSLRVLSGQILTSVPCKQAQAEKFLQQLAAHPGFKGFTAGASGALQDVVRLSAATLLEYKAESTETHLTMNATHPVPLHLNAQEYARFKNEIEQKSLDDVAALTKDAGSLAKNFNAAVKNAPALKPEPAPMLAKKDPAYLMDCIFRQNGRKSPAAEQTAQANAKRAPGTKPRTF